MKRLLINFRYVFNIRKPIMMIRMAIRLMQVYVFDQRPLRYVDLSIGEQCNMKCRHCFVGKRKPDGRRIDPRYYAEIVKQAMKMGAVNFSFQGGEPLIYPDLKQYIKAASPALNLISVTTNGKALTYKKAKELKSWGVDIVTISVDTYRTPEDNVMAIEAMRIALKAGLKVTVSTVMNRTNKRFVEVIAALAKKNRCVTMIMMACPMGELAGSGDSLRPDQVRDLRNMEQQDDYIRTDFKANWRDAGCGAAKEILYIKHDGETYCCPYIPISFGNVGRHSLSQIRQEMLKIPELAQYHKQCIAGEGVLWKML